MIEATSPKAGQPETRSERPGKIEMALFVIITAVLASLPAFLLSRAGQGGWVSFAGYCGGVVVGVVLTVFFLFLIDVQAPRHDVDLVTGVFGRGVFIALLAPAFGFLIGRWARPKISD